MIDLGCTKKKMLDLGKLKIFSLHKLITHSIVLSDSTKGLYPCKEPNNIRRISYHTAEKARGERVQGCNNRIVFLQSLYNSTQQTGESEDDSFVKPSSWRA